MRALGLSVGYYRLASAGSGSGSGGGSPRWHIVEGSQGRMDRRDMSELERG